MPDAFQPPRPPGAEPPPVPPTGRALNQAFYSREFAVFAIRDNLVQKIGFGLLVFFTFLMFGRPFDFVLSFLHIPMLAACLGLIAALISRSLRDGLTSNIGRWLVLYSVWLVLAVPTSYWKGGSVELLTDGWSKSFAFFVITASLAVTVQHTIKIMRTMAYAFSFAAILALLVGITDMGRLTLPQGLYSGANDLATAMMIGVVVCWFMVQNPAHGIFRKVLGLLCLVLLILVMLKTGSRGALITLIVVTLFLQEYYSVSKKLFFVTILLVGGFVFALTIPAELRNRYITLFSGSGEGSISDSDRIQRIATAGSSNERLYLLLTSLRFTAQRPIFGYGPGQFMTAENELSVRANKLKGNWHGTHNTYTEISSEAGIPALVFFVLCMLACRKELKRVEKLCLEARQTEKLQEISIAAVALKMLLLAYAVFFMFEHIAYSPFLPSLAGLIFSFSRAARWELLQLQQPAGAAPALV